MKISFLTIIVLVLAISISCAQDMAELELDHNVRSDFVTPHTTWAKPYALGKTKVLFFLNGRGTNPREVIELCQRFDIEAEMVFWARIIDTTIEAWHGGDNGVNRMAQLLTRKRDAFVFLDISPDKVPTDQQYTLLRAVTAGAGLVLIGTDDKRVLKDKNRLKELPAFIADVEGATAFTIMQGKGVRLPPRPEIAYRRGWEVDYDEWVMRLGKAILWAAGKEPRSRLTLLPREEEIPRSALPGPAVTLQWQGEQSTIVELTLRRDDGATLRLPQQILQSREGSLSVQIPVVRAGKYYLDAIAYSGKNVLGFGSTSLLVVNERSALDMALDRDWAEFGETLTGKVILSSAWSADERVSVSLFDRRGREIARQNLKSDSATLPFRFAIQRWFPMLVEVRATLHDNMGEIASAWRFAHVVKRHRNRFNFVMWDIPRGNLAPWAEQALANTGVAVHLASIHGSPDGTPPPVFAAYEMAWIPYTTHISAEKDEKGIMKPVCWADEVKIQEHVDSIVKKHVGARRHGVFVYSLGDEIAVRGSCLSPHCLSAYRKYLQEQYGNINALNASWGTNYTSFEEVQLSSPDDNDEAGSLRAGNFPRWFDRKAYQSYNFCKLCERFGEGFRRIDPLSRCGFEGAGTFRDADDLDGFVRSNTFWTPYPGAADEVLRSIAPRDFPRSNWMGYTKDADTLLEKYWRMVTRGCDSVWWWRWEALGRFHGWLSPTLDPYPAVKEILRDTQIVRDGLGDLLLACEMQTDGIGILYSLPSGYAAKVQTSPSFGTYENNHSAFHNAMRDLGLNFLYFTDRQMRLNEVDLRKFKVIILPITQAMSTQEAEMFRAYVRDGGVLVADVRPAIYDGHVKPLGAGQLDDVFGIKRVGFTEAKILDGQCSVPRAAVSDEETLQLPKLRVDTGVTATQVKAWGQAEQTPLLLVNRFGKGHAILLNFAMSTYPVLSATSTSETAAEILRVALSRGSVAAAFSLTDSTGKRLRNVEVTRWMNGAVQIVSVFRHHGAAESARLLLPQPMHVYDLKSRKYLGQQQAVNLAITPYRAMFYALSPQPLKPVSIAAKPSVRPGGVLQISLTSTLPQGRQAVKVQVRQPNGMVADWATSVEVIDQKGKSADIPIAFNDPRGAWTIDATELFTGKTLRLTFRVQ